MGAKPFRQFLAFTAGAAVLLTIAARADVSPAAGSDYFENKVRPILVASCYKCHSSQAPKLKGSLSVEYRDSILAGGDTGPAVVPGNPDASLLIKAIRYGDPDLQMPPQGRKLSAEQIAILVNWVRMGAPGGLLAGKGGVGKSWKDRRNHWAFKPIRVADVPAVQDTNWVSNPIDNFILAKLEAKSMKPSPPADKRTLIRRATYDLIGLPPTPEEVEAFVNDNSPDAFAKVVDRLLASPQYGERWGRHWLDVARYADTKGDINNQDVELFPYAWTYRDYVIRSFNRDLPFNRFIEEQIAADRLPVGKDLTQLAALGFLTLGPRFNDMKDDIYNDRIDVVCKGFLGLTVTCARCHDHKFDPITQKDYYALRGIFDSSLEPPNEPMLERPKMTPEYASYVKKHEDLDSKLAQLKIAFRERTRMETKKEIRKDMEQVRRQIADLEGYDPGSPPCAEALLDSVKPHDSPIFLRGSKDSPGPIAPRKFLDILNGRTPYRYGSGRLELANSIINPGNPLTARVIVNRVWQWHFGQGFVLTPDDFGNQSEPPSHPELLDYLAMQFMRNGWSIKRLTREIMLSSAYQQSSHNNPRYAQIDPQNRLLWRANIQRLEFEELRDSILALGGQLDLSMGGRPVNLGVGPGGYSHRRTIYGTVDRKNLPELYTQFDFANPDVVTGKRYNTTVPQQALFMMNSPLVTELARKLAIDDDFQNLNGREAKIKYLYERIYQRDPTDVEIKLGMQFIEETPDADDISDDSRQQLRADRKDGMKVARRGGRAMSVVSIGPGQIHPLGPWAKYAHALLQANEAIFVN